MTEKTKTIIVLFGATGDLAQRYILPAISELQKTNTIEVILVGRRDWKDKDVDAYIQEVFADSEISISNYHYAKVDLKKPAEYQELSDVIVPLVSSSVQILYYLSLGPDFFIPVVQGLASFDLHIAGKDSQPKIMIEKPFGRDLSSATKLNLQIHDFFTEEQIYRVDHYLGKNLVADLHAYRMQKGDDWYAQKIKRISITANENLTVLDRGEFYDANGAVRDYLQNHLLQVLAVAAMRTPISDSADDIRDKKMQFLQSITPFLIDPRHDILFGQYEGYRQEEGVNPQSKTETFVRTKMHSDDPLWQGIVFQLQTGKGLDEKKTQICIVFQDGSEKIFEETPENKNNAYVRLLQSAIDGDQTLFVRWDSIKAAWIIVDELLSCTNNCPVIYSYPIGSKGPK